MTRRATRHLSRGIRHAIFLTRSDRTRLLSLTGHPNCRAIAVALTCLWPTAAERVGALGLVRWKRFCRFGLTAVLVGTAALTLPTFALRLYAQNVIPALEWHLMTAIADLPANSLVLLGFPPDAEMIGNSGVLQERVLGRSDITIASAFNSNNAERLAQADAERRPVFLAFVFAPRGNLLTSR